jgi:hypothetical protein
MSPQMSVISQFRQYWNADHSKQFCRQCGRFGQLTAKQEANTSGTRD